MQEAALTRAQHWLANPQNPVHRVFGYAGTGKTTIARRLAEGAGKTLYAAYTGKAASVMRRAGCPNATTIHSLIYQPSMKSQERLRLLREELDEAEREGAVNRASRLRQEIRDEEHHVRSPHFVLKPNSEVKGRGVGCGGRVLHGRGEHRAGLVDVRRPRFSRWVTRSSCPR
jgi:hypothetical protein